MNFIKCKCGCIAFEQIIPVMFDETDFRVWNSGKEIVPEIKTGPIVKCLACSRLIIPSTSMVGKNNMHPDVQAFRDLIEYVEKYNKALDVFNNNADVIQKNINRIHELQSKVAVLEGEWTKQHLTIKELNDKLGELNVKARKGSGDEVKSPVPKRTKSSGPK